MQSQLNVYPYHAFQLLLKLSVACMKIVSKHVTFYGGEILASQEQRQQNIRLLSSGKLQRYPNNLIFTSDLQVDHALSHILKADTLYLDGNHRGGHSAEHRKDEKISGFGQKVERKIREKDPKSAQRAQDTDRRDEEETTQILSNSHINDVWRGYVAATVASNAKEFLSIIPEHPVAHTQTAISGTGELTIDIYYIGPWKEQVKRRCNFFAMRERAR